jgi:5-methylcytosine-specific restriction protein A
MRRQHRGPRPSPDDYIAAFDSLGKRFTETHKNLLLTHYSFPRHRATARQLAYALGFKTYGGANGSFGHLAKLLYPGLRLPERWRAGQSNWWGLLATPDHDGPEWAWTLRLGLVSALRSTPWFKRGQEAPVGVTLYGDEKEAVPFFSEGRAVSVPVNLFERNRQARQACLRAHGYACSVCGLRLEKRYGDIAKGLTHVHHVRPLASVGRLHRVDPVKDLRPICPNCHFVIHSRTPTLTIRELRRYFQE